MVLLNFLDTQLLIQLLGVSKGMWSPGYEAGGSFPKKAFVYPAYMASLSSFIKETNLYVTIFTSLIHTD